MKARYVVQGHRDKEKATLIQNSPTLRDRSIRLFISVAGMMKFKVWTQDVAQAYIQSQDLARDVYVKPHPIFGLDSGKLPKLRKPQYGLSDGGDYWSEDFSSHVTGSGKEDLEMEPTIGDLSLFFKMNKDGVVEGIMGLYVDDSIGAGDGEFEQFSKNGRNRGLNQKKGKWLHLLSQRWKLVNRTIRSSCIRISISTKLTASLPPQPLIPSDHFVINSRGYQIVDQKLWQELIYCHRSRNLNLINVTSKILIESFDICSPSHH